MHPPRRSSLLPLQEEHQQHVVAKERTTRAMGPALPADTLPLCAHPIHTHHRHHTRTQQQQHPHSRRPKSHRIGRRGVMLRRLRARGLGCCCLSPPPGGGGSSSSSSASMLLRGRGRQQQRGLAGGSTTTAGGQQQQRNHLRRPDTLALLREGGTGKLKWERRAPLAPRHVEALCAQGFRVLVQPSRRRVFPDAAYAAAGAAVQEDLRPASVILGVKQPRIDALLPDRTFLFFSHTIKAQGENMPLLDACLQRRVRLLDYECITETGERGGPRLVYFGAYAGMAGMIDALQALGQNLLARGFNSPFLHCPAAYMYPDLPSAQAGVRALGAELANEGLAPEAGPLVFAFTGRGKVAQGAQAIFSLLPHEWVEADALPALLQSFQDNPDPERHKRVYGVRVPESATVARLSDGGYDRAEYRQYPERYRPTFHETVAPYISVLVNGIYWDARYPRLLSNAQLEGLWRQGHRRLLAVSDISCDVEGSVECLTRTTSIEAPFLYHKPLAGGEGGVEMDGEGVAVCGVDILPSELPREASEAFGDALLPLLPSLLLRHAPPIPYEGVAAVPTTTLPPVLQGAVITTEEGRLAEPYHYIAFLRQERERELRLHLRAQEEAGATAAGMPLPLPHATLKLVGHLFDSGLINQVLDVVEARGGSFKISECLVRPNRPGQQERPKSTIVLDVEAPSPEGLRDLVCRVQALAELLEAAEATVTQISPSTTTTTTTPSSSTPTPTTTDDASPLPPRLNARRRVLLLGAGRVAAPALHLLLTHPQTDATTAADTTEVTVVGASHDELQQLQRRFFPRAPHFETRALDVAAMTDTELTRLVATKADVVLSLLPAALHPRVARACLAAGKHLVTSSYVSPELAAMDGEARRKGLVLLNEAGLDPGMDHLSAMRLLDGCRARGGVVRSFRSVCGGLPAPEAAARNPFLYKFSWSPRAVLAAAENPATYRHHGQIIRVPAEDLLRSASPLPDAFPTMRLEVLPNRDALAYETLYGLDPQETHTCFRGTLRYQGWSELMLGCRALGLLSHAPLPPSRSSSLLTTALNLPSSSTDDDQLTAAALARLQSEPGVADPHRVLAAVRWLGLFDEENDDDKKARGGGEVIDAFSRVLEKRLAYEAGERDMVAMRHDVVVDFPERGEAERHVSTLLAYGDGEGVEGGYTAMAKTVGWTSALAVGLLLDGGLDPGRFAGVRTPLAPDVYNPLLARLEEAGMVFEERVECVLLGKQGKEGEGADGEGQGQRRKAA